MKKHPHHVPEDKWYINDNDPEGLREFLASTEWSYFIKKGKDKNNNFLIFLMDSQDKALWAIKSTSSKRHIAALSILRGEQPSIEDLCSIIVQLYALCAEYGTDFTKNEADKILNEKGYGLEGVSIQ